MKNMEWFKIINMGIFQQAEVFSDEMQAPGLLALPQAVRKDDKSSVRQLKRILKLPLQSKLSVNRERPPAYS